MGKSINGKELGTGISQRKDGRYEARFTNHAGKRESVYGKTPAKVRQALLEARIADDKKSHIIKNDITMNEWFDMWLEVYKKSCRNTTISHYKDWYNHVRYSLGDKQVNEITPYQLQIEINNLKSNHCRKKVKYTLTNMFKYAQQDGIVTSNPATNLKTKIDHEFKKDIEVLDDEQIFLLLDYAKLCYATWFYPLVNVALFTGARIGEIFALTWGDIDFNKKKVHITKTMVYVNDGNGYKREVHPTKTGNGSRTVPLMKELIDILTEWKDECEIFGDVTDDTLLFTSHGNPLSEHNVSYYLNKIEKEINSKYPEVRFPHVTPHMFRHTFATKCVNSGMRPKTLQTILGHSDINITLNLYCHVKDDVKTEEMNKVFCAS